MNWNRWYPTAVIGGLTAVYFIIFPDDLKVVLSPFTSVLSVTDAISPGAYAVIAAVILAWVIWRTWGRSRA